MNRLFLIIPLAVSLAACAPPVRIGPQAPIITAGKPMHQPPLAWPRPRPKPPRRKPVEVYPYRPPASAPDAAASGGTTPAAEAPRSGPVSEPATSGLTATPKPASALPRMAHVPPPPLAQSLSPAATTLLKRAERQRQTQDYVSAAATLERALGIQPRSPSIWNRLARIRVEQGRHAQAANLAKRSNALARANQVALKRDNWAIIAVARQAAGDMDGAMQARRNARSG